MVSMRMGGPGGKIYGENSFPERVLHPRIQGEYVKLDVKLGGSSLIHGRDTIDSGSDRWASAGIGMNQTKDLPEGIGGTSGMAGCRGGWLEE